MSSQRPMKRLGYLLAVVALAGVSALIGAVGGGLAVSSLLDEKAPAGAVATSSPAATATLDAGATAVPQPLFVSNVDVETTITEVVQEVGPAVVTVVGTAQVEVGMGPFRGLTTSEVSGSGVFISEDGYILTSNHVVEETVELWVVLADGTRQEAVLIGSDVYADLAVLKTDGPAPAVAVLGNSDVLDPGETVIAIGSPLGEFTNSVTVGVVSGKGRSIDTGRGYKIEELIQTDAAINQGNSGGPLVNLAGEVVGINTLVVRASESGAVAEGLGFAIASNAIAAIAEQIVETGSFARPDLGIDWQLVNPSIAFRYRLPVEYGAYITAIEPGGPAEQAGLRVGDIVNQVGGVELDESNSFLNLLYQYHPGDQVTIGFVRNGWQLEADVVLGGS